MGKVAVEHVFNGPTTGITSYNSNYTMLGTFIKQYSGITSSENYVSTVPSTIVNQLEVAGASFFMPFVYKWSNNIFWIFVASNATAAVTRNFGFYEFDVEQNTITWKGFITLQGTTFVGNKSVRGLRVLVTTHSTGTVSTSGPSTTINGSGTQFTTDRIAVGARIGFGSTDPTQITTWYDISTITDDTTLTIAATVDVSASTPYVIEEIRLLTLLTNVTLTNGGLFLIKGLNPSAFSLGGTSIPEATNVDNIRASYFLKDAATSTVTVGMGIASDSAISATEHYIYVINLDIATAVRVFKSNIRASLTVSAGASTDAFVFKTDRSTITGTASQVNNGRIFTVNHGSAIGEKSVWFVTTTRVYRINVNNIVDGASNIISDFMIEIPPGGSTTYALTNTMNQVDYSDTLDRILIPTTSLRIGTYIGEYDTTGIIPYEKIFGTNLNRLKLSTTSVNAPNALFPQAGLTVWTEGGYLFAIPSVVTTGLNWLYILPISADALYSSATNQRVITPKLPTLSATKLYRIYVQSDDYTGVDELELVPESYRLYFRTTGIDDNTGSWNELSVDGDVSAFAPSNYIQFMAEFNVMGQTCIPTKIYSISCIYDDFTTDGHYQPSVKYSDYINKRFAWWFAAAWNTTVPDLRVRLYDADNNNLLVDDNTATPTGTFEKSTDGGSTWGPYDNADRTNSNTYIRYTPASMADNIKVKFLLTEL